MGVFVINPIKSCLILQQEFPPCPFPFDKFFGLAENSAPIKWKIIMQLSKIIQLVSIDQKIQKIID